MRPGPKLWPTALAALHRQPSHISNAGYSVASSSSRRLSSLEIGGGEDVAVLRRLVDRARTSRSCRRCGDLRQCRSLRPQSCGRATLVKLDFGNNCYM